jgi:hypothetical protein
MDGHNEAEVIAADVEHHDVASTVHSYCIRGWVAGSDFLNVFPLDLFRNRTPVFDPFPGFRVLLGRLHQERNLDDTHVAKMSSPSVFVKPSEAFNDRRRCGRIRSSSGISTAFPHGSISWWNKDRVSWRRIYSGVSIKLPSCLILMMSGGEWLPKSLNDYSGIPASSF